MLHIQQPVTGWLEAVDRLPDGALVKAVAVQWLAEAKAHRPGVRTMLRYVNDPMQHVDPSDTEAIREQRAREWFNAFIDGTFLNGSTAGWEHWRATDIIGWWNEYYANSQSSAEKELWWRQERAAARVWQNEYQQGLHAAKLGHIRLAIGATAVGNDIPLETAVTATLYDCIVDYHAYDKFLSLGVRDPGSWPYHCGRWVGMDAGFRAAGYEVDWLFGEAGPYGGVLEGWRHGLVLGGDAAAYVAAVKWFIQQVKTTLAYQQGRVYGFALFTTGGGAVWQYYETNQDQGVLNMLADMTRVEWVPVVLPPPPPERARGVDVSHWQGSMDWTVNYAVGGRFAYVKATEGTSWLDPRYFENLAGARAAGVYVAPYHFYRVAADPTAQAAWFCQHISADICDLPPALDLEDTGGMPSDIKLRVKVFLDVVEATTGWRCAIYTSPGWWNSYMAGVTWANGYPLWVAHWTAADEPWLPLGWTSWKFWQYTSDGNGATWGADSGRIDLNRFNGDEQALAEYVDSFGGPPLPLPTTPRVVVPWLMPPTSTLNERRATMELAKQAGRTLCFSADDAADIVQVPSAKVGSKVVALSPERWGGDIVAWLLDHGAPEVETMPIPTYEKG